jgi:hypothetical protein
VRVVDGEVERALRPVDEREEPGEDVVGGLRTGVQEQDIDVVARARGARGHVVVTSCRDRSAG